MKLKKQTEKNKRLAIRSQRVIVHPACIYLEELLVFPHNLKFGSLSRFLVVSLLQVSSEAEKMLGELMRLCSEFFRHKTGHGKYKVS